jgi:formylglycine-generating enzyme required for sulfatase activity
MDGTAPKVTFLRSANRQTQGFRERLSPELDPNLTLTLVQIPAGIFVMGSTSAERAHSLAEGPQRRVEVERFFLSQTPITQAQWRVVSLWQPWEGECYRRELMPNPSYFQRRNGKWKDWLGPSEISMDNRPVERVSWFEAIEFCRRLSQRTGRIYRLPSEAQWEYACRAESSSPFHFGETITPELANYDEDYPYRYRQWGQTTPVGMFPANAWGLQDMHGNVWEWCLDHWHGSYDGAPCHGSAWLDDAGSNPKETRQKRMLLRGGSWTRKPGDCRSASRIHGRPDAAYYDVGFRVACLPQDPSLNP